MYFCLSLLFRRYPISFFRSANPVKSRCAQYFQSSYIPVTNRLQYPYLTIKFYTVCGIAGIINGKHPEALRKMADIQAHRGPDDWGLKWFNEHQSGLAHRRLSILDLSSAGHQPMVNKRGDRWISFNGEIYNYLELKDQLEKLGHHFVSATDTEVILAAYDQWGPECVRAFNGMFAFGIYDTTAKELFIARDHLGVKPLYYAQKGETFAFASETKAIFEIPGFNKEIDPDAILSTLLLLWVPEPKTGFNNVHKLPAGHYGYFRKGKLTLTEYWDVPVHYGHIEDKGEDYYVTELRHLLEQAVQRQMIADVPVGAFLSGGLDSSVVVALMRKAQPGAKLSTYTIGFSAHDKKMEAMPDDAFYARKVAQVFNTDHNEIILNPNVNDLLPKILWHLDDPIADGAAINTYLIAKAAKDSGTTVLLNGMGGDEVFGGYRRQLAAKVVDNYQRIPSLIRHGLIEPFVNAAPVAIGKYGMRRVRWAKRFLSSANLAPLDAFVYGFGFQKPQDLDQFVQEQFLKTDFRDIYPIRRQFEVAEKAKGCSLVQQMTYMDTKMFLSSLNLAYSDKATMAASVEGRPPLIDKDLVEFASGLPDKYKINGRVQKYLLKRASEAYIPKEIIYRRKSPFTTPLRSWMKSGLDKTFISLYQNKSAPFNRILKTEAPLQMLAQHQSGAADNALSLWGLLVSATWINQNATAKATLNQPEPSLAS